MDWQALLAREGPAVWRTVYRILGNAADAEECFQEVFLAAVRVSRRGPVESWHALLVHLAAARAVDRLRRRRRRGGRESPFDAGQVQSREPLAPQAAEDRELLGRLREALAELPPQQAEVFCLHCLEDCSYLEIGRQLGLPIGTVGVLLHRARKRLQVLLHSFAARDA